MPTPLGLPTPSRPTPEVLDTIFFEYVDTQKADYRRLPVNAAYPDALKWPGYFLLKEDPVDYHKSIRWWTNGFANQGTYNYEQLFDKESPDFPIIVRRYAAQRGTAPDITRTANGTAFSGVWICEVTAGGQNYNSAPDVSFSAGAGTGATGRALINPNGQVVAVIIVTDGTGYTANFALAFSGGGGTGAAATAKVQENTCTLVREQHGDFPAEDPRRGRYTIITRVYRILPGAIIYDYSLRPGGTIVRTSEQDVAVGTLPLATDGVMSSIVDGLTVAEATRKTEQIVESNGTTVITTDDGFTLVTTDPQTSGLLATTYRVRDYNAALPAIDDAWGDLYGLDFFVYFVKEEAIEGSANVLQIIKSFAVPDDFVTYPKVVVAFPGTFEFADNIVVPNSNQFQYPPPWPGNGTDFNTFAQTFPRQRQVVGRVLNKFSRGYTGPTEDAYFVYTPGVASKLFSIPNDTLHGPIKLSEVNAGGTFLVENIEASNPAPPYDPNQILTFPLGSEIHLGNSLYWTRVLQVSEQRKPEDFPPIADAGQFTRAYVEFSGQNEPTGTINPGGARLVLKSTSAADTMALVIWGRRNTISGRKWDSQSYTLTGTTPVLTEAPLVVDEGGGEEVTINRRWYDFFQAIAASNNAGDITIAQQGGPAYGSLTVVADPAEAGTLTMGPAATTTVYTSRTPYRATVVCPAASALVTGAAAASWVRFQSGSIDDYFWFSNAAGPTTDPAPGGTGHAVVVTTADANTVVAASLRAAMAAVALVTDEFAVTVSSATVALTGIELGAPSMTFTQDAGNDFTFATVSAGTAQAANQIRRAFHTDGVAVSTSNLAAYIEAAVNADADFLGTYFGTGTTENTYLEAAASSAVVDLTARLGYSAGAWTLSQSGAAYTITAITDGANGPTIATIPAAAASPYTSYADQILTNPALVLSALGYNPDTVDNIGAIVKNVPAGVGQITGDSIAVPSGEAMRLQYVVTGNPPLAIAYETSPDNAAWTPGSTINSAGGGVLYGVDIGNSVGFVRVKLTTDNKARSADIRIT